MVNGTLPFSACIELVLAGYYCPNGTAVPASRCLTATSYCPEGSAMPLAALPGFYAVFNTTNESPNISVAVDQAPCTPGFYCANGRIDACPAGVTAVSERCTFVFELN